MRKTLLTLLLIISLSWSPSWAEDKAALDAMWKIRREAAEHSRIMETLHYFADLYGPRLTGSPNLKAADDWAVKRLTDWGLENAHLEAWDFGHPGWLNERFSGFVVSPVKDTLTGEVLAWTPGTKGPVKAQALQINPPEKPKKAELASYLREFQTAVKGKIVLVGKATAPAISFAAPSKRREDSDLKAQYDPINPVAPQFGRGGSSETSSKDILSVRAINEMVDEFLVANGALVRLNDAGREHGQIRAFNNRTFDVAKAPPTVVLRNEDFGRIARLMGSGNTVELEFDIVNRSYPEGKTSYNVIAEIPGTDPGGEVVMLGGHLDSWHAATGATDNAIGCAVMMEAARILEAIGVKPRRTIRVALWSGEEQGLLGSKAYVKQHFGTFENPKADFGKLTGYMNIDMGTGRARGASVFGPPAAAAVLRSALEPLADLGVIGASFTKSRRVGGSDHTSFNAAGLPGISFGQDPIEYQSHTWHTNLDTYERVIPDDAIKSAITIATAVYQLATREESLPRLTKDQMPAPVPDREEAAPTASAPSGQGR